MKKPSFHMRFTIPAHSDKYIWNISVVGVDLTKVRSLIKPWITYFNQICSDFFSLHNENSWKLTPFQDQHSSLMNFVGTIPRPLPSINSTSYTFNHHVKFRFFKVSGLNPTTILGKSTRTRQMMKLNLTWNLKAGCSLKGFVEYF